MKILLINPPVKYRQKENVVNYSPRIPLGLGYIAAVLEENDYDVEIIDSSADGVITLIDGVYTIGSWTNIRNKIKSYKPNIVGISCIFSSRISSAISCAKITKDINQDILTIIGGIHPSIVPKEVLRHKEIDIVAIGEADYLILDILKGKKMEEIDGMGYKQNGKIIINPKTKWIEDLDILPFPARHLLPMDKYLSAKKKLRANGEYTIRLVPRNSVATSRGCPFNCRFCVDHNLWGRKFRGRSPENVIAEIKHLIKEYGIKQFSFEEDNFSINKVRLKRICELIIEEKLDVKWDTPEGTCILTMDRELLTIMKKSGCNTIMLAFDSGNEYVLHDLIGKYHTLEKAYEVNSICRELDIKVLGFFIIGLPRETEEMIKDTINFAMKLNLDEINVSIATPQVGTKIYRECIENNYMEKRDYYNLCDDDIRATALVNTPQLSAERILYLHKYFHNKYNKIMKKLKKEVLK